MSAPLQGIRVVAVEQFGAGPFASMYLADMGADVIKVEDPGSGGDIGRHVPPGQVGTDSLYFEAFNRGKRSIALDLKNQAGREIFERLVARSDVVFNNLRGDLVETLGLTYEALSPINPRIVCASLSAYDRTGPKADYPGYDALMQAETGWAAMTGEPDGPPIKSGLSMVDYAAGLVSALGLVAAVFDAGRTGRGRNVDTSLYDVALAMLTYPATWYLSAGIPSERQPNSGHPSIVPFQFFQTADGHIAVACPKEKFFRTLITILGVPELANDPRFTSFATRKEHRGEVLANLGEQFLLHPTDHWLSQLRGRVPCAPVRSLAQTLDEERANASHMVVSYPHPVFGQVTSTGSPMKFGDFSPRFTRAPALDADRVELLEEIGYSSEDTQHLVAAGAFGSLT